MVLVALLSGEVGLFGEKKPTTSFYMFRFIAFDYILYTVYIYMVYLCQCMLAKLHTQFIISLEFLCKRWYRCIPIIE